MDEAVAQLIQAYFDDSIDEYHGDLNTIAEAIGQMIAREKFKDDHLIGLRDWATGGFNEVRDILDFIRDEDAIDWTYTEQFAWILQSFRQIYTACSTLIARQVYD